MNPMENLYEMQLQIFEAFKAQNPEMFDVVFEIEGKKLYAEKLRLSIVSTTFNSMLSDRWISKNDVIPIKDYSFNDFKEFLTFIYSGECQLSDKNILTMIDIAEFYQVNSFKKYCDYYMSNVEHNLKNVFKAFEISNRYPNLEEMKRSLKGFVKQNFEEFVKCKRFLKADKSVIEEFASLQSKRIPKEEIFKAVYEWVEYQVVKKQEELNEENFNKNDAIKAEITPFLSNFEFNKMKLSFLNDFVDERVFIFPNDEFKDFLQKANAGFKVKITNSSGQSIHGTISYYSTEVVEVIKTLANEKSEKLTGDFTCWNKECKKPAIPNPLIRRDEAEWYLFWFLYGFIGIEKNTEDFGNDNYLLAEMTSQGKYAKCFWNFCLKMVLN
uniref:BTB domain-containing protein n=1 Tax=Panagrolaimus davidi TaxID=227884 RepID=A0A914PP13_9BILA